MIFTLNFCECRKYSETEFKKIVVKWEERRKKKEGKKNRVGGWSLLQPGLAIMLILVVYATFLLALRSLLSPLLLCT